MVFLVEALPRHPVADKLHFLCFEVEAVERGCIAPVADRRRFQLFQAQVILFVAIEERNAVEPVVSRNRRSAWASGLSPGGGTRAERLKQNARRFASGPTLFMSKKSILLTIVGSVQGVDGRNLKLLPRRAT